MRVVLATCLVLALVACGSTKLAVSRDGRAVLNDAYDGHLDRHWSCGSLRAAYLRLPVDMTYSTIPALIGDAAEKTCDHALASLKTGISRRQVAAALGKPDRGGRCELYRWPATQSSGDGARICFAHARATLVQTSMHL